MAWTRQSFLFSEPAFGDHIFYIRFRTKKSYWKFNLGSTGQIIEENMDDSSRQISLAFINHIVCK